MIYIQIYTNWAENTHTYSWTYTVNLKSIYFTQVEKQFKVLKSLEFPTATWSSI